VKLGDDCFNAVTFCCCRGVNIPVGVRQSAAATFGEICHPVTGSIAIFSSTSTVGGDQVSVFGSLARSGWRHSARKRAK
jgi:hypothetical protein